MEFPAHIVFSCLLVYQPAIFVDSKRDGTGAAHGRKGFRMKRAELDRRIANGETLDDIVPALMDDGADITSYDDLKRMAKGQMLCADGKPVMFGETLYGGDGRDWLIVGIAGAWSYDVYGLHVAHDGKKEKKPLRAEWLVHELTDAGEEV